MRGNKRVVDRYRDADNERVKTSFKIPVGGGRGLHEADRCVCNPLPYLLVRYLR